eukprot:3202154-Alexandrium_andersonii.AAC.1
MPPVAHPGAAGAGRRLSASPAEAATAGCLGRPQAHLHGAAHQIRCAQGREPVSYTHLTLPTICSV